MKISRIIGKYEGDEKGPLLLITAGVHGNEASGVKALQGIFEHLQREKPRLKGSFLGLAGNIAALKKGERYIDEDLNRTWTKKNLEKAEPASEEQKQMRDLIEVLQNYPAEQYPERYFIDCHTTSSDSLPYLSVQEVGGNNAFAEKFPFNIVRGFSDIVDGSIDKYFSLQGMTGFTFEGGQHFADSTQANQEAMIWFALQEALDLDLNALQSRPECFSKVSTSAEDQTVYKIIYRHGLQDKDTFTMEPGFKNFEEIEKGELLALHNGEEIHSRWDATIFMPLYQAKGNDGFFVIEEI